MEDQLILTMLEYTGIQNYIFSTNNLGINIGASELVNLATSVWLFDALPHDNNMAIKRNQYQFDNSKSVLKACEIQAEVIYYGGGNALLLFRDINIAREFTKNLSSTILMRAPGLEVVIQHQEFDKTQSICQIYFEELLPKMAKAKKQKLISTSMPGLSVTAQCVFTGKPANVFAKLNEAEISAHYLNEEIIAKHIARVSAEERLHALVPEMAPRNFDFIYDFDDFGTPGVSSYIGVVHIDGNGLGKRIKKELSKFNDPDRNADWLQHMRSFSSSIKETSCSAMKNTVEALMDAYDPQEKGWHRANSARKQEFSSLIVHANLKKRDRKIILLPIHPIVFGGDDVTFIADGRLSLALAQEYLSNLNQEQNHLMDNKPLYSSAGIAMVHTHFPFSRAYDLSEELIRSAKNMDGYPEIFSLDWHFATTDVIDTLATIREKEHQVKSGSLALRPLFMAQENERWNTWEVFRDLTTFFQTDPVWSRRRSQQKTLKDALRKGPDYVQLFRRISLEGELLPRYEEQPNFQNTGWYEGKCGYFDSLEAADFFIPVGEN